MTFLLPNGNELMSCKELAAALKRTPQYVSAMRRDGFIMPGDRATVNHALIWLHEHPQFRQNKRHCRLPVVDC
ncbi:MAG TPA: hypothetical protein PKI68_01185 [Pontiellaceae bacterium]|nr:hypothetical protein [Pontiellaceae bacterium]